MAGAGGTFAGQVVIVTGASKGIGRAMAAGYAREGGTVVISSRDQERCEEAAAAVRAEGGDAHAIACHMGRAEQIDALFAATVERFGRLDVVVNNAATNPVVGPLVETTDELAAKLFAVNVIGPLHLARLAAGAMAGQGGGAILNIVSRAAFTAERDLGVYGASKAALVSLNKAMALEWAERGVRVNAIAPGPFATVMVSELFAQEEYRNYLIDATAQRRIADPTEIVGAALFLTGPDATFITGAVLPVDGGMSP